MAIRVSPEDWATCRSDRYDHQEITMALTSESIERFLGHCNAEDALRMLRAVLQEEQAVGYGEARTEGERAVVRRAVESGFLEQFGETDRVRLTPSGYEFANFSKEYLNWIELGRLLPQGVSPELIAGRRVLDVGCSSGRHMATFSRMGARVVGIELQESYLALSRVLADWERIPPPTVARATAAKLPFRSESFDVVFCRLVINYCPLRLTLAEFARVLVPGGLLILTVETFSEKVEFLRRVSWRGNLRTIAYVLFGQANAIVMRLTGHQMSIRAKGRMYAVHSNIWPTRASFRREIARHGFEIPQERFVVNEAPTVLHARRDSR